MKNPFLMLSALGTLTALAHGCGGSVTFIGSNDGGSAGSDAGTNVAPDPDSGTDGSVIVPPVPTPPPGPTITPVRTTAVDKLDLLFVVDNSASMGDKQGLLKQAAADLIRRFVRPNCINNDGTPVGVVTSVDGACTQGRAEFKPLVDIHIGVVSSALGGRGGDQCAPDAPNPVVPALNRHNDDKGHLINRGGADEHAIADLGTSNYLAWLPNVPSNAGKPQPTGTPAIVGPEPTQLITDFQDLMSGVHEYGCGLENQLEAWYHFLVQPDPYLNIIVDPLDPNGRRRTFDGVDAQILKQRHDFLRPDSLVAVILLTDEEDSGMDPLAVGGQGWAYTNSKFPGSCGGAPARGTSACDSVSRITSVDCTSCAFTGHASDPSCTAAGDTCTDTSGSQMPQPGYYPTATDVLNTRTIRMKQRYGVDPQYPIQRYTDGLGGAGGPNNGVYNVPDSKGEHAANGTYQLTSKACRNPLFAANLPADATAELCNLTPGPRTPDMVFFATITGVPWQLLTENSLDPNARFKASLTPSDWKRIVGTDPNTYDYSGIDPHMYEAIAPNEGPRAGLPGPTAGDTADPFNGREWDNGATDLQYACTFELPSPKDCADPLLASACDCGPGKTAPLCQAGDTANARLQIRGKAYPGIRQLTVARDLGDRGIAASICSRTLDLNSADYGYRPAVTALLNRATPALRGACLPSAPPATCVLVETLPRPGDDSACSAIAGLETPTGSLATELHAASHTTGLPICIVHKVATSELVNGSCVMSSAAGWCVDTGQSATECAQSLRFSPTGAPQVGAALGLYCPKAKSAP